MLFYNQLGLKAFEKKSHMPAEITPEKALQ
jgi:hypothetical protein